MSPFTYSKVAAKNLLAPLSLTAPVAPECPARIEFTETKLSIQYKRGVENTCNVIFEKEYIEKRITIEIESFGNTEHQEALKKAERCFRKAMELSYSDSECWLTGSYAAGVDLHTSDLDFTVKAPSVNGSNQFAKLLEIRNRLRYIHINNVNVFEKVYVQKGMIPVLQMVHAETGVSIDVTIDNDTAKRNTQLLCWYGQLDAKFPLLCKAVKAWASKVGVEGASRGRLNSFSLCMMVLSYLQVGTTPAVLPNLQEMFPELNGEIKVESDDYTKRNLREEIQEQGKFKFDENKSSLAALFLGCLRYYADFDFSTKWISVKSGKVLEKQWSEEGEPLNGLPQKCWYIVVEDPFLPTPHNCAGTVQQSDYVERIQMEFREEYHRILETNTIFSLFPCNWSRRLMENGMKRDRQIHEWEKKKEEVNDVAEWGKTICLDWGEPRRKQPEEYWNLEMRRQRRFPILQPWPDRLMAVYSVDAYLI
ncbi:hypothetical protein GCK72_002610 [Caenorhabditis remanei]|uniref:Uncharacterized protein n=1 Tax=Caenorhabditis remanei TaxID=31234 RepID=A0A6A5HWP0_CAERE|nr:hypothetical protein GCK72_002610 [Caenorhabditis remanei]KAF1770787.1 hypothetical protein GCK72_002610 [Caenorhabditis remanei]